MRREGRLDTGHVERVTIDLSEAAPINVGRTTYTEGLEARYDMHFGLELGVVLSGRMRRYFRGHRRDLGAGEAWLVGMWEPHGFSLLEVPCESLVLVMLPQTLAKTLFEEAPGLDWIAPFTCPPRERPRVGRHRRREMHALALRLVSKLPGKVRRRGVWSRLLAMEMLLLLRESWDDPSRRVAPRRSRVHDVVPATRAGGPPHWETSSYGRINTAVQLVLGNRRLVTAQEAARACRMSRNTFNARFEALMGISFAKFALRYRVSGAASQLLRTGDPLKAVASDWGFTDASHLHRCFMKHYGCPPAGYRQRAVREVGRAGK